MKFGNYQYSLTSEQQSKLQLFLRLAIPDELKQTGEWELLHDLTYADSWTNLPMHPVAEVIEVETSVGEPRIFETRMIGK